MVAVMVQEMDVRRLAGLFHDRVRDEIRAQNDQLVLAALWADQHAPDGLPRSGRVRVGLLGERAVRLGGPGTPEVVEFAAAELAPEAGITVGAAAGLIADALDLRHRFPLIWQLVVAGSVRAWVARQVARQTRELSLAQAGRVDRRLAAAICGVGRKRLDHLIRAAVLAVDAERMAELAERARRQRFVRVGQTDDGGVGSVWMRLDAPDVVFFDAGVERMARILMDAPGPIAGVPERDAQTVEEWRAVAVRVLAQPLLAARIWIEFEQPDLFDAFADLQEPLVPDPAWPKTSPSRFPANEAGLRPADPDREPPDEDEPAPPDDLPPDDLDLARPGPSTGSGPGGSDAGHSTSSGPEGPRSETDAGPETADPAQRERHRDRALRRLLRALDPAGLGPSVLFHVHCAAADLAATAHDHRDGRDGGDAAVGRVEEIGPVLLEQARQWFGGGSRIMLQPVIDSDRVRPVDGYEIPSRIRQALFLRTPASVFPFSADLNRSMDVDHTIAYRHDSKAVGQTGLDNLGPLGRAEHRFKTHGRVRVRQPEPGSYLWRTVTGRVLVVNDTGTHDLGIGRLAEAVWNALQGSDPDH